MTLNRCQGSLTTILCYVRNRPSATVVFKCNDLILNEILNGTNAFTHTLKKCFFNKKRQSFHVVPST